MANCELIKCINFNICCIETPKWNMLNHPGGEEGLCFNCWAYRGKLINTNEIGECGICLENKILIKLECFHLICIKCWDKTIDFKSYPSECPFCRKIIGKWKLNF